MHNACIQVATYERKLTQANRITHAHAHTHP